MKESLVSRLRTARRELTENIIVDEQFWIQLIDSCIVTGEHVQLCKAKETSMKKIELLLDMLERRDDSCFQTFCQVLSIKNMDLVKKYLDIYPDGEPIVPSAQTETEDDFNRLVSLEHLQKLREQNESLKKYLKEEQTVFDELEIVNTNVQNRCEEAENEVRNRESQHRKDELSYANNVKALEAEKVFITRLEKERDVLEAEISRWKADFHEKNERKNHLEEDLRIKTQENKKLVKQISFHRTHLSSRSLGSRSFSEDV